MPGRDSRFVMYLRKEQAPAKAPHAGPYAIAPATVPYFLRRKKSMLWHPRLHPGTRATVACHFSYARGTRGTITRLTAKPRGRVQERRPTLRGSLRIYGNPPQGTSATRRTSGQLALHILPWVSLPPRELLDSVGGFTEAHAGATPIARSNRNMIYSARGRARYTSPFGAAS
jgi:hypothetical protein